MLPSRIHSWAQSDRLSLAFGFFDNGMNFLKTILFTQFSKGGVVGVEFPIQAYIAAALGQFCGRENINRFLIIENKKRIELTKTNDTLFKNFDYINTFNQVAIYKYKGQ
jgi:hypothetical protein